MVFPLTKKAPRGTLPDWSLWPMTAGELPLISADPGEGTGIVLLTVPREEVFDDAPYGGLRVIWYEEIIGAEDEQADQIMDLCWEVRERYRGHFPLLLEDFSLRKFSRDAALLTPVRLNAKIEYGVHLAADDWLDAVTVFKQPAALAMDTIPDQRLKDYGLYAVGQKNARMAMAHALTFLRRARESASLRKKAWEY